MTISRGWIASFVAAAMAFAGSANAAPIYYQFTLGQATITVTKGATTLTLPDTNLTLDGVFASFDSAIPALVDFEFTTVSNQPISLTAPYGGFDQIVVNDASMIPGPGYAHLGAGINPDGSYSVVVAPVHVDGVYSASYSAGPPPPPVSNIALSFDNAAPLTATINVIAGTFTLKGITLAVLSGFPGESIPLVVKADLKFSGMQPVPTPEPGVISLLAAGVAAIMALRARKV